MCINCDLGTKETTRHILMECQKVEKDRNEMINESNEMITGFQRHGFLEVIMVAIIEGVDIETMTLFWTQACKCVYRILVRQIRDVFWLNCALCFKNVKLGMVVQITRLNLSDMEALHQCPLAAGGATYCLARLPFIYGL